jgi:hypothetical protein
MNNVPSYYPKLKTNRMSRFVRQCYWRYFDCGPDKPDADYSYNRFKDDEYILIQYLTSKKEKIEIYSSIKRRLMRDIKRKSTVIREILEVKETVRKIVDYAQLCIEARKNTR